jgi:flagellar M-ring protein FliF
MDNEANPAPQQIAGVQRLVAAAVPGLDPSRVVVSDHRGVTLSAPDVGGTGSGAIGGRLEIKRQIEDYVAQKIARMLDGALGAGQAIVSVDASLNFDATKTTIRDLLPSADQTGEAGRVVRRRQVTAGSSAEPAWTSAVDGLTTPKSPGSSTEVEYEYGQRIDEIIAAPGALTRLSVGVIVPSDLDEERRARVAELVKVAAGINVSRGDAVSIQSLSQMHSSTVDAAEDSVALADPPQPQRPAPVQPTQGPIWLWISLGVLGLLAIIVILRPRQVSQELTAEQRQQMLDEIKRALNEETGSSRGRA